MRRRKFWSSDRVLWIPAFLLAFTIIASEGQPPINVGLVVNSASYPLAQQVMQMGLSGAGGGGSGGNANNINVQYFGQIGCNGPNASGQGAYEFAQYYYTNRMVVAFGPTCAEDLEITSRLVDQWDILELNFWIDRPTNSAFNLNVSGTSLQMSTQSAYNIGSNLYATLRALTWRKVGFFFCPNCYQDSATAALKFPFIKSYLSYMGMDVLASVILKQDASSVADLSQQISRVKDSVRVLVLLLGDDLGNYVNFLQAVAEVPLDMSEYQIVIVISGYSNSGLTLPWATNSSLAPLFERVIILYNNYFNASAVSAFAAQLNQDQLKSGQLPVYMQLFESAWLYATKLQEINSHNQSLLSSGVYFRQALADTMYNGPFGGIYMNEQSRRVSPYTAVAVVQQNTFPLVNLSMEPAHCQSHWNASSPTVEDMGTFQRGCLRLASAVVNTTIMESLPPDMPTCGFNGELCDQTGTIIIIVAVMGAVLLSVAVCLVVRRMRTGETSAMPWAIQLSSIKHVDSVNSSSLFGSQHIAGRSPTNNHADNNNNNTIGQPQQQPLSAAAAAAATAAPNIFTRQRLICVVDQTFVIADQHALRERIVFDKSDLALLFQLKTTVSPQLNAFIGLCYERTNTLFVLHAHCLRGSLYDLLFGEPTAETRAARLGRAASDEDEARRKRNTGAAAAAAAATATTTTRKSQQHSFDSNFHGAFVRDLVRGLDFLHNSAVGYHGGLCASQCLIDSHWILKLSGFGENRLLMKWRCANNISMMDGGPFVSNVDLPYYAPEVRQRLKALAHTAKVDSLVIPNKEGQAADIYSFGIILYELTFGRKFADLDKLIRQDPDADLMPRDEDVLISTLADSKLPPYPTMPNDAENVHPDLIGLMHRCFNSVPSNRPDMTLVRKITDATHKTSGSLVDQMLSNMEMYTNNLEKLVSERTSQLEEEQKKADALLLELLPKSVADELKVGRRVDARVYHSATVMYSDIVGFTQLCSESSPMEVVALLSGVFSRFDMIISEHNAYKVETIGDAYMVASGVPRASKTRHVRDICSVALQQRDFLCLFQIPHRPGQYLHCRWGINTGQVYTGVVGLHAPRYFVFGQAVSLASKMEQSSQPDKIQMTLKSHQLVAAKFPEFKCAQRGSVKIDGFGHLLTYWLEGVVDSDALQENDRIGSEE